MRTDTSTSTNVTPRRRIRWWPVVVILFLALVAVIWVRWTAYGRQRQDQNIAIANVVVIGFLLLLVWCLFFSRLKWKIRLGVLGVVVGVAALLGNYRPWLLKPFKSFNLEERDLRRIRDAVKPYPDILRSPRRRRQSPNVFD